jgi:hypothetical protein
VQILTSSTYRRAQLFESDRCRWSFVEVLGQLRIERGFRLIGWVASPEPWPWSSFRFYYLNDSSVLSMDRLA